MSLRMFNAPPLLSLSELSPSIGINPNPILCLVPATIADLDQLVTLDQQCFGQLWSRETYARELDSPNSEILLLQPVSNRDPDGDRDDDPDCDQNRGNDPINPSLVSHGHAPTSSTEISTPAPIAIGYGCVWSILDEAHITILGVHPEYRRQGWGEVLMYGLFAVAHQRGLTRATLEVSSQNQAAIALYEKLGFRQAGCRKGYYSNGDDAAILWKSGLQHPQFVNDLEHWESQIHAKAARSGWHLRIADIPLSKVESSASIEG